MTPGFLDPLELARVALAEVPKPAASTPSDYQTITAACRGIGRHLDALEQLGGDALAAVVRGERTATEALTDLRFYAACRRRCRAALAALDGYLRAVEAEHESRLDPVAQSTHPAARSAGEDHEE